MVGAMTDQLQRLRELGPEIERRYTAMGISQRAFSDLAGISTQQLRPILRGTVTATPRPATLVRLSRALGLPPDALSQSIETGAPLPDPDPQPPAAPEALPIPDLQMAAQIGRLDPEDRAEIEAMILKKLGDN